MFRLMNVFMSPACMLFNYMLMHALDHACQKISGPPGMVPEKKTCQNMPEKVPERCQNFFSGTFVPESARIFWHFSGCQKKKNVPEFSGTFFCARKVPGPNIFLGGPECL